MPIYAWKCVKCGYTCEIFQDGFTAVQVCPKCQEAMEKQISAVSRPVIK